jgi:hypothetical protein
MKSTLIWIVGWTVLMFLPARPVEGSPIAYASLSNGDFGSVDLGAGVFTLLGNSGQTLAGLGEVGSTLYGLSYNSLGSLYSINLTNGSLTLRGSSGFAGLPDFGSTTAGLFAIDEGTGNLYSINSTTGAKTVIGPVGIGFGGFRNLSTGSSTLFFNDGGNLYTINTTTGAATLLGATGVANSPAIALLGSTLYGIDTNNHIETFNTVTGAGTTGALVTGDINTYYSMAPVPASGSATPEPGSLSMLGVASVGLMWWRRRIGNASKP